jgi:hypothetical protein
MSINATVSFSRARDGRWRGDFEFTDHPADPDDPNSPPVCVTPEVLPRSLTARLDDLERSEACGR